jgi:hypothetical protein
MTNNEKKSDIIIDTYGKQAPDAAKFGKGVYDQRGAQEAQDARRALKPGIDDRTSDV